MFRNLKVSLLVLFAAVVLAFGGLAVATPQKADAHTYTLYNCTYLTVQTVYHGAPWHIYGPVRAMSFYQANTICW